MVKVEVIEKFTLKKFDELKNVKRKNGGEDGYLFVGDTFECTEEMASYLTGNNPIKKIVVKVIEVEPKEVADAMVEEDSKVICEDKEVEKLFEEKPKKKKTSKK